MSTAEKTKPQPPIEVEEERPALRMERCDSCYCGHFAKGASRGECRANPPSVFVYIVPQQNPLTHKPEFGNVSVTGYPTVSRDGWCADRWRPAVSADKAN